MNKACYFKKKEKKKKRKKKGILTKDLRDF